jgi:hypothetical protein
MDDFGFIRFINFVMHLDIHALYIIIPTHVQNPK